MTIKQLFIGKTEDSRIQIVRNAIVESIRIGVNALVLFFFNFFMRKKIVYGDDVGLKIERFVRSILSLR